MLRLFPLRLPLLLYLVLCGFDPDQWQFAPPSHASPTKTHAHTHTFTEKPQCPKRSKGRRSRRTEGRKKKKKRKGNEEERVEMEGESACAFLLLLLALEKKQSEEQRGHKRGEKRKKERSGPNRDSNPGPLAPEAKIIPLDHQAAVLVGRSEFATFQTLTTSQEKEKERKGSPSLLSTTHSTTHSTTQAMSGEQENGGKQHVIPLCRWKAATTETVDHSFDGSLNRVLAALLVQAGFDSTASQAPSPPEPAGNGSIMDTEGDDDDDEGDGEPLSTRHERNNKGESHHSAAAAVALDASEHQARKHADAQGLSVAQKIAFSFPRSAHIQANTDTWHTLATWRYLLTNVLMHCLFSAFPNEPDTAVSSGSTALHVQHGSRCKKVQ